MPMVTSFPKEVPFFLQMMDHGENQKKNEEKKNGGGVTDHEKFLEKVKFHNVRPFCIKYTA